MTRRHGGATVTNLADRRPDPQPVTVEATAVEGDPLVWHVRVHGRVIGGVCATDLDNLGRPVSWSWWAEGNGQLAHGYADRMRAAAALTLDVRIPQPHNIVFR